MGGSGSKTLLQRTSRQCMCWEGDGHACEDEDHMLRSSPRPPIAVGTSSNMETRPGLFYAGPTFATRCVLGGGMLLSGGLSGLLSDRRIGGRVPLHRRCREAVANQRGLRSKRGGPAETLISNATANGQARTKNTCHGLDVKGVLHVRRMRTSLQQHVRVGCGPGTGMTGCLDDRRDETTLIMAPGCGARLLSCCREDAAAKGSGSIWGGDRHAIARNVACGARWMANGRGRLLDCGFGLPRDPCCWRQKAAKRESYLLLLARRSHHAPTPALRTLHYRRPSPNMTGLVVLSLFPPRRGS
ncbi:hypothetical protein DE146DRAFT_634250 [Phaeosphaeria sp. MPI-PUGE-AT-0046c]|nr:hypothetical protein DE146DRAFT_634250 [Phaeosphaeria sp. MPI-PUGE-AT-0046c]